MAHTNAASHSDRGLDPDHLSQKFMESACQYYTVARFAMHAKLMPVLGNLFHAARPRLDNDGPITDAHVGRQPTPGDPNSDQDCGRPSLSVPVG
jgi:hypothetical protein